MRSSSDYIKNKVYNVNLKYSKLQNKTEELFFRCLDEERSVEYFYKKLDEIWGNIDYSFINDEILEYANIIEQNNIQFIDHKAAKKEAEKPNKNRTRNLIIGIGIGVFLISELKFVEKIKRRYELYYNSPEYRRNKEEYLKNKVKKYNNQVIPYFDKYGRIIRYVQLSTYLAMKYNTAMTRAGWNKTLDMAELYGYEYFWIPPHSFSCKHCAQYQGKLLNIDTVTEFTEAEEQEGDILHPNCKCELLLYTPLTNITKMKLTDSEIDMYYDIRQKVNSLTLKKERILTEIKIQKELGNQDEVDRLKSILKEVNSQIRELQDSLPTEELRRKVIAINR